VPHSFLNSKDHSSSVNLFLKLAQSASMEEVVEDLAEIAAEKGIHLYSIRVKRGIGLENLTGIRERTRFRKSQRDRMSKWSFAELRGFIEYKAKLAGVPVMPVDARNTSRTCPKCGHIEEGNPPTRGMFLCRSCGHFDHMDVVGATNIACAAKVAWWEVAEKRLKAAA